jgi:hypothetical protein
MGAREKEKTPKPKTTATIVAKTKTTSFFTFDICVFSCMKIPNHFLNRVSRNPINAPNLYTYGKAVKKFRVAYKTATGVAARLFFW